MLLPIRSKNPPETLPLATCSLIALNVLIFLFTSDGFAIRETMVDRWALKSSNFDAVHILSSMFLHGSIFHLLGNMLFLYLFGFAVEGRLKAFKFLVAYLISGFAGDFLHHFLIGVQHPDQPSLGASGAIMGIVAAAMWIFPHAKVVIFYLFYFRVGTFDCPMWGVGLWYLGFDVLWAVLGAADGVGHLAHIGGAVGGLIVCVALRPTRDSAIASEAKATLAETKELRTLSRMELEELHRVKPDDTAIILNWMHRSMREPGGVRDNCRDAFMKALPAILREHGAGQVAQCIPMLPENSIEPKNLMQIGAGLERMSDHAGASRVYEMVVNHPNSVDADLEAGAFRVALIAEQVFRDQQRAWAWYEYIITKWPMGPFAAQAKARMSAMQSASQTKRP